MTIEKLHAGNAEPRRGDIIGLLPAIVVGQKTQQRRRLGQASSSEEIVNTYFVNILFVHNFNVHKSIDCKNRYVTIDTCRKSRQLLVVSPLVEGGGGVCRCVS